MDANQTQSVNLEKTVSFRCTCGQLLTLNTEFGGTCSNCQKSISSKALNHELSRTVAIHSRDHRPSHQDFSLPANPGETDLVGKSLDHFEIISPLGQGGMGYVYRAFDKSLQRYVAVKVLHQASKSGLESDVAVDRLLQEAVAQARVSHPNIVPIYFVGKHLGDPFLAMELIPGKTVAERLIDGNLSFYEIVFIAWQITDALRFTNDFDLIHGDIKPSNILLQDNGIAKLGDFGMARRPSESSADVFGGTPNYLAPEVLQGQKASIQSDMYALGVTLYEMTFGKRPVTLSGISVEEWSKSHAAAQISFPEPWPEEFPEGWRVILTRLLERDPANRYANYEDLAAALIRVAPAQKMPARFLPRMIAAGIDHLIVGISFAVYQILTVLLLTWVSSTMNLDGIGWLSFLNQNLPWYLEASWIIIKTIVSACGYLPIVIYTLLVGYWRQSFGRASMHVRVVNRYGLRPSARTMMGRSVLRMAWMWVIPSVYLLSLDQFSPYLFPAIMVGMSLFSLFDLGYMIFFGNGTSLHDRWYKTRVVLDTDTP